MEDFTVYYQEPTVNSMRLLLSVLILLPIFGLAQSENERRLIGFGLEGSLNVLDEPTLSFEEYKSVINSPEFFLHSDSAELLSSSQLFTRNGVALRLILKGKTHKNLGAFKQSKFNIGALYNSGNNYSFNFRRIDRVRLDTITLSSSTGTVETVYQDTIYYHDTEYSARSQNLGIYGEFIISTGEGMPGLSTGVGLAVDMTMLYEAQVRQTLIYESGLFTQEGTPAYITVVNPQGQGALATNTFVYGNSKTSRIKMAYFIRPYIPVRLETALSDRPNMAHFSVDINAKIGTEIQFNPNASINARMFYSIGLGLSYYL